MLNLVEEIGNFQQGLLHESAKTGYHHTNLWKLDQFDFFIIFFRISAFFLFWLSTLMAGDFLLPFEYWDGPNYVYVAKTLYNIPPDNPWSKFLNYPTYYFACHLPGFPLVIRFFSFLTFNSYWVGNLLAILFSSSLSPLIFRRLLIVYDCVNSPKWTTLLYLSIPIRSNLYHCVGASEPLFLSFCYLVFIFYKTDQKKFMLLSLCGACLTRIEGLALVGTIGLCYLIKFDIKGAFVTSLALSVHVFLLFLHQIKFGTYKAYFLFNQNLIQLIPFKYLFETPKTLQSLPDLYPKLLLHFVMFGGTLILFNISIPMAIFCTVYLIYSSMLNHHDIYRYILPGYILSLLIGYDFILSNPQIKRYSFAIFFFILIITCSYSLSHLLTNISGPEFLREVMNS